MRGCAWLAAVFGVLSVLLMHGCDQKRPGPAPATARVGGGESKYLALGDSYTIGQSVAVEERYPVQLVAALRKRGVDLGEPTIIAQTGWTTGNLLAAMDAQKPVGPYALVTVLIGVNNQFQGRSIQEYQSELGVLLDRAVKLAGGQASHVVVLSTPDWGATPMGQGAGAEEIGRQIDAFNEVEARECAQRGIVVVDVTAISRRGMKEEGLLAVDGLHPSGKMYGLWVGAMAEACKVAVGK